MKMKMKMWIEHSFRVLIKNLSSFLTTMDIDFFLPLRTYVFGKPSKSKIWLFAHPQNIIQSDKLLLLPFNHVFVYFFSPFCFCMLNGMCFYFHFSIDPILLKERKNGKQISNEMHINNDSHINSKHKIQNHYRHYQYYCSLFCHCSTHHAQYSDFLNSFSLSLASWGSNAFCFFVLFFVTM